MSIKLLIDMNLSPKWTSYLTGAGVECIHWTQVGAVDAPDHYIMTLARERGYTVFTHDLDFGELLALTKDVGPSVIQLRGGDPAPQASGPVVVSALGRFKKEIAAGALVTISLSGSRVRVLPLIEGD